MHIIRLVIVLFFIFNNVPLSARHFNNKSIDTSGMKADTGSYKVKWLLNDKEKNSRVISWALFPAFNDNDGFMSGFSFTNSTYENPQKLSFAVTPIYSIKNFRLLGQVWVNYDHFQTQGALSRISYRAGVKSFDFNSNGKFDYCQRYTRIDPSITFHFRHTSSSEKHSQIYLKSYFILEDDAIFNNGVYSGLDSKNNYIQKIEYKIDVTDELQSSEIKLALEYQAYASENYLKMTAIADQRYLYAPKKNLFFRFFASGFILNTQRTSGSYQNVFTRGSIALIHQGFNDYTYDEYFFSRQNQSGFQDDQVSLSHGGGFKTPLGSAYSIGMSNHFAAALNFSCDLPFRLPSWIKVYFDVGTYSTRSGTKFQNNFLYNGGLSFNFKDIAALHIPLVYSKDLGNVYKGSHRDFSSRLSFTLNLHKLDFWNGTKSYKFIKKQVK